MERLGFFESSPFNVSRDDGTREVLAGDVRIDRKTIVLDHFSLWTTIHSTGLPEFRWNALWRQQIVLCGADAMCEFEGVEEIGRPMPYRDGVASNKADPTVSVRAVDKCARSAIDDCRDVASALEREDNVVMRHVRVLVLRRHLGEGICWFDHVDILDAELEEIGVGVIGRVIELIEDGVVVAHRCDFDDVCAVSTTIPHVTS